ncbi:hypothetical protein [Gracilibacillus saliphilus]|uniref:hypothetical protein n=1 Tax=Gracilibacillus saliphilus TaxID=543890 RepID=UPI0013D57C7B|nr:hypothetical protein [Gracilibacillus saliphilus]
MIQVTGVAEIAFTNNKLTLKDINERLDTRLVRHSILTHNQSKQGNKVTIKFIMKMAAKPNCKTIDDYNSYLFHDFSQILPIDCGLISVVAYDMRTTESMPIKHINEL